MKVVTLTTKDNIEIAADYYENRNEGIVIVSPGWCMTKDSDAFKRIAQMFSEQFDVLSFDFRGHGKSGGWFTFTAKELLDLDAVVKFAKAKNYKKIYLAGFSLGAGTSLIYASKNKDINSVIAVSAPADFGKIENQMWKKEAWGETFKKFELNRFLSIRPYPIPLKKIKPIDIIDKIECPVLFLAGEKDPTVHSWHTKDLYDKALCKKEFKLFENGCHAEDLYLHFEGEFKQICFDWLKD